MTLLLQDGYIVTMNPDRDIHNQGFVLVNSDGRIADLGPMSHCPDVPDAEVIDCSGRMVLPGLIDTFHRHWGHLASREPVEERKAAMLNTDDHELAARLAAHALLATGVTSVLDLMPVSASERERQATAEVLAASGLTAHVALGGADEVSATSHIGAVRIRTDPVAVEAGKTSEAAIVAAYRRACELGQRIVTEITPEGHDDAQIRRAGDRAGRSAIVHMMELGVLDSQWIIGISDALTPTDIALMSEAGCHAVLRPVGQSLDGIACSTLPALMEAGINCTIGIDGPDCTGTCDMLEQMKATVMTQNTLRFDPGIMSSERALEMATINGARALGQESDVGSLDTGKRADIAVFDMRAPHCQVAMKPISVLVACARASSTELAIANGRVVYDRSSTGFDMRDIDAAVMFRDRLGEHSLQDSKG